MSSASSSVTSAPVRLTGRVKWFNNKTGFGFISVVGGNDLYKDASEIFVHHSAVTVSQEQYRYLVEGEYVEFSVVDTESGTHKFQAGDVRGVKGGKLFCETRREHRATQEGVAEGASGSRQQPHQSHQQYDSQGTRGGGLAARGGRVLRSRGGSGARGGYDRNGNGNGNGGGGEWMLVRRGRPGERAPYRPRQEHSERTEQEAPVAKSEAAASASASATTTPTPTPVASSDVPSTPRTGATSKKPRQTKPPTF
jgi:cold shock CspA family protein